jgi:hypothetical protein
MLSHALLDVAHSLSSPCPCYLEAASQLIGGVSRKAGETALQPMMSFPKEIHALFII